MLLFLTGEGRVLRFVPLLLGIFWSILYDFVFIRDVLLAELIAFFYFPPQSPPFVVLLVGVGFSPMFSEIPIIHVHNRLQQIQPFEYHLSVPRR
jgi:hypothetical protein